MNLQVLLTFGAVFILQVGVTTAQISQCGSATACTTTLTCDRATIDGVLRFTCGTNGAVNFSPAGNSQNGRFHVFHRIPQDACYGATIGGTQRFFTVPGNGDCENFVPKSSGEPSVVTFGNVTSPGSSPGTPPGGSPPGGAPPGGSPPGGTPPGGTPPGGSPPQNPPSKPPTGENGQGGCSRQQILSGQATCVRNGPCCATPGGCPDTQRPEFSASFGSCGGGEVCQCPPIPCTPFASDGSCPSGNCDECCDGGDGCS